MSPRVLIVSATPRDWPRGGDRSLDELLAGADASEFVRYAPGLTSGVTPAPGRIRSVAFGRWFLRNTVRISRSVRSVTAVHANDFQAFTIAVLPSMVFSRPLSIHVRDIPPDRYHWRLVFRWASKIVCVSDDVRSSVLRIGGALVTGKTVSLPNPVPAIRPQKFLQPDPIALMIGAIEPRKRQASFVEQYSDAVSDAGLKLVLIGETKDHDELARIEAAQCASATIETFGYRSDPLTAMAKASVLISYSLREGLPRVLIEAVAIGVPVLTPMVHGAEQILGDELARFSIVRDDTCGGWAKALAALGTDDWNTAIDHRQEWICSNWSGEILAKKFFLTLTSSAAAGAKGDR